MLYLWLQRYFCVLHTIGSLVALHPGHLVTHISYILLVIPLLSSLLTWIHKSWSTSCCLNWLSHSLKHISLFLVSQYLIYLFLLEFCLLFITNLRAALHFKYSTPYDIYPTSPLHCLWANIIFFVFHIYPHAAPTCDTNNKECVLSSICHVKRISELV